MKKADFYNDNDNLEAALHTANLFTFGEAWLQAHRYTKEQAYIDIERKPDTLITRLDAYEMLNLRSLPEGEAWDSFKAEEARKAN